ncbi:hypothetical protein [Pseudoclavibacter sp. RFBB5]|uniref:hypothetical protein n=1 Tax=Pseudoclavibacter sp. RFBB5 TaxID=2080574 RepID=UPI000CE8E8DF|nr:hypothetical protein [Pseudoclavibacter sp. RFBB5]PPG29670.1 hypothetical protein C5B97_11920 [Pseudoclavibacter sp. RFBB5]
MANEISKAQQLSGEHIGRIVRVHVNGLLKIEGRVNEVNHKERDAGIASVVLRFDDLAHAVEVDPFIRVEQLPAPEMPF